MVIPFFKPQINKGDPRHYFKKSEKIIKGRHCHCCQICKQSMYISFDISTSLALLESSWVPKEAENLKEHEFLALIRCFQLNLNKLRKTTKKWCFSILFGPILDVFEDFSNLTEKQRLKPKNSCSMRFVACFGTQLDSRIARLVEQNNSEVKKPCVNLGSDFILFE